MLGSQKKWVITKFGFISIFFFQANFFSSFFFVSREVTNSPLWEVYGYAYLVVKLIPSIIICILNMWMLILMKTILKRRRKLRNNPLTRPDLISNSVYNPSDDRRYSNMLTLPMQRIDENNEDCNEQKSSTSGTYSSRSRSKMKKKKNREINLNFFLATFFFTEIGKAFVSSNWMGYFWYWHFFIVWPLYLVTLQLPCGLFFQKNGHNLIRGKKNESYNFLISANNWFYFTLEPCTLQYPIQCIW